MVCVCQSIGVGVDMICSNVAAGSEGVQAEEARGEHDDRVPQMIAEVKGPTQLER